MANICRPAAEQQKTVAIYLEGGQLRAIHIYPEGVQVLRAGVGQNAASHQRHGRLAHFVLALVLVKPQLPVLDQTPAGAPLAVYQDVEVA